MKVNTSPIRQYSSLSDYRQKAKDHALGPKLNDPASKVELSQQAQEKAQESAQTAKNTPTAQSADDSQGKEALKDSAASLDTPSLPSLPKDKMIPTPETGAPKAQNLALKAREEVMQKAAAKGAQITAAKIAELKKDERIKKPAIFFFTGHAFEGKGLKELSDFYPGAELFDYDQKDKAMELILKREATMPVALIGHGLGADTAIEVAKDLNKVEHGFRRVDLLISLDALGFNNDLIPQNVTKNINFIGNQEDFWGLFNDSPKMAKNSTITQVENILRPESHNAIDDAEDIRFKIFQHLQNLRPKNMFHDQSQDIKKDEL